MKKGENHEDCCDWYKLCGLVVTAVCLAELGHDVTGTDTVADKIDKASQGIPHIYEPGLEELLKANLKKGNLTFSNDLHQTTQSSDVLFVSVNTSQKEDGSADMAFVEGVSREIAEITIMGINISIEHMEWE